MYSLPETQHNMPQNNAHARQAANLYKPFFVFYSLFVLYFYVSVVEPYLASGNVHGPRLLADAITYETICVIERDIFDLASLRDIGPCLGLWIFSYNSGLISVVNAALIVWSVVWLSKVYERAWEPMLALILINPVTFCSIFGANKEIFGLASFAMLAIFIRSRSLFALSICLVTALFTRLPALATTGAYCVLLIAGLPRTGKIGAGAIQRYWLAIATTAIIASLIAALYGESLQYNMLGDFSRAEDISRSTQISLSLNYLSNFGAYLLVYIIRVALNFYSGIIGFVNILQGEGANYYTVAVSGSSALFIILSGLIAIRGIPDDLSKTAFTWNLFLFIVFVTMFLCLSPVIQHRYFFPIYVMMVLFIIKKEVKLL